MEGKPASGAYVRPTVEDYGDLLKLTGDLGMLHVGIGSPTLMATSSAAAPGGTLAGATQAGTAQADGSQLPAAANGGAGDTGGAGGPGGASGGVAGAGGAGSGSGGGGGGGGGDLPFTGLALGAIAAVGGGLSATGVAIRRWLRRERA
jgi:hypothetical protein